MTPQQVDELTGQLRAVAADAGRLSGDFSPRELGEPPAAGEWSASDNLMHLTLSSQALAPRMSKTLGKLAAAGLRSERPSRADWVGRLYAWALEPPVHVKVRAPQSFVPPPGTVAADALAGFLAEQERLLGLAKQSAGLDLAARKVPSPVSRLVRYNVYSAFRILLAHQRRHLWQARRAALAVRAKPDHSAPQPR
jgi:hypothetical protein